MQVKAKKKKEEKKPEKAMDAGARGRRLLQRREYRAKVSEFVPKELEDQVVYENPNTNLFSDKTSDRIINTINKASDAFKNNKVLRTIGKVFKSKNPGSNYTKDGKVVADSYVPEASSAQEKAMHDAKIKKMEDDKVAQKKKKVDEACWKGYEKKGMKTMFGKRYPNCVKKTKKEEVELEAKKSCGEGEYYCYDEQKCKPIPDGMKVGKDGILVKEDMKGMSQKSGDKRSTESGAGMTAKGVAKYNRRTGGNLKTAVTTPPSKLKAGSKAAKRRKSFCARSKSWTGPRGKAARRRWNCEYEPELPMIDEKKKLYNTSPLSDRVSNWSKKINEGDSYVKSDRNKFGLPKDLKSTEKKSDKKVTSGVNYGAMAQSYEPQGEMIEMARKGKGAINTDVLKNNPNLDPLKPGDYIKLKRLSAKVDKINERKKLNPNAIFPTVANVKIKNEIISDTGISTRNQKKKFGEAKMTPTQKEKKEKYVKGMKKDKGGFTKRYGKDGKSVMYATATKMAMKKEEAFDEAKYEKGASDYGKTSIRNKRAFGKGGNAAPPKERGAAKMLRHDAHQKRRFVKKNNKYGATNKPPVYGAPSDEFKKNKNVKEQQIPDLPGLGGGGGGTNAITDKAKTKTIGNTLKDIVKIGTIPARFMLNIKSPKDPLSKFAAPTTPAGKVDSAIANYKSKLNMGEGSLHKWFKGSKSKDGKGGWVNVVTGGTCASDKPGEGTPKCVSSSKRASMSKAERLSASRRKKKADPGQQSKSGAAKPTYVATDKKKKVDEMNQGPSTPVGNYDGKIMPKFGAGRIGNVRLKGGKSIADLLKKV